MNRIEQLNRKIKKLKTIRKKQAKIINALFEFLENKGYKKQRFKFIERNGKIKASYYEPVELLQNGFFKTLVENIMETDMEKKQ